MLVCKKNCIKRQLFKDLNKGDVFYFVNDYTPNVFDIKIYMRCGHTENERVAVNLETGICYTFKDDLPVELLNVQLDIKGVKGE